jgi:hypothetical protein
LRGELGARQFPADELLEACGCFVCPALGIAMDLVGIDTGYANGLDLSIVEVHVESVAVWHLDHPA